MSIEVNKEIVDTKETISEKELKKQEKFQKKEVKKEEKLRKKLGFSDEISIADVLDNKNDGLNKSLEDIAKDRNSYEQKTKRNTKEKDSTDSIIETEDDIEIEENIETYPNVKKKKKKKKKSKKSEEKPEDINIVKELLSLIVYIGAVILICYLILTFVGCRSRVDGSSMYPTLSDNDSLWVDKLSYTFGDPERFDVIIFNYSDDVTYVKRIIGLPGERVRIDTEGNIYINDQLLKENYGKEPIKPTNIGRASQDVILGEDEYFVLGDNRNNSSDSRWADVGNVSRDDIVGKAVFRIYPFSSFGPVK